jgi:hypothetical protein
VNEPRITPGSHAAILAGCICPVIDNNHGDGYRGKPDQFMVRGDCPLHAEKSKRGVSLRSLL